MQDIITMSWAVDYNDGTTLTQYNVDGTENALKSIDWSKAIKIKFESQFFKSTYNIDPLPNTSEIARQLRIRHFRSQESEIIVFMVIHYLRDQEVNDDSVISVMYITPNGIVHECEYFWCNEIAQYVSNLFGGKFSSVPLFHHKIVVKTATEIS